MVYALYLGWKLVVVVKTGPRAFKSRKWVPKISVLVLFLQTRYLEWNQS